MKRLCILFLTFSCVSAVLCGQVSAQPPVHEIRVGWGDMGFEKASFRDSQQNTGPGLPGIVEPYYEDEASGPVQTSRQIALMGLSK